MPEPSENAMHHRNTDRPQRVILVWPLALVLAGWAAWDGGGFTFGGPQVNTSPTYDLLRAVPFGMATWGVSMLALAFGITYGIGRDRGGNSRPLNVALGLGVGFWILWAAFLVKTWLELDQIPSWPALGKAIFLIGLYYLCGRGAAPHRASR